MISKIYLKNAFKAAQNLNLNMKCIKIQGKLNSKQTFQLPNIFNLKKYFFSSQHKLNQSQFKFSQITQKELELCLPGLSASFAQVQPLLTFKINQNDVVDLVNYLKPFALKSGVSNIVRNKQTDKILGCTLMFDAFDQKDIDQSKINMKKWGAIFELLHQVSYEYLLKNGAFSTPRLYAHSFMTGIFPQHKSKHVGRQLFMYQLRSCKQKGYKYVMRQTTNHIARKVLLQRLTGYFKQQKHIKYCNLVYQGKNVMKDTPYGASLIVSDLSLIE